MSAALDAARAVLEVNYLGLIATTQAFAPVLADNGGGAFVNVLSVGSWIASPILSTYSASKSAAWNFTNSARVELKRQGTHVVGVHVGFVDTDLTPGLTRLGTPQHATGACAKSAPHSCTSGCVSGSLTAYATV